MALRCSIRSVVRGFPPVAFARTDHSGRPIAAVPRADTHLSSFTGDPLRVATIAPEVAAMAPEGRQMAAH
jgi:hypothetical protein